LKTTMHRCLFFIVAMSVLAACGGGGGGGNPAPAPTTVQLTLKSVAKAGESPDVKGLSITLALPSGVTLKTVSGTKRTAPGIIRYSSDSPLSVFSNVTSQLIPRPLYGVYSSATAPGKNTVTLTFISATAFGAGEFATITCDVAPGVPVTENSFQTTSFSAVGDTDTLLAADLTALFDAPKVTLVK